MDCWFNIFLFEWEEFIVLVCVCGVGKDEFCLLDKFLFGK